MIMKDDDNKSAPKETVSQAGHGHRADSLVTTDSPDDFAYEGQMNGRQTDGRQMKSSTAQSPSSSNQEPYVTVDNPDDFE